MEAVCCFEVLVPTYKSTWYHNPHQSLTSLPLWEAQTSCSNLPASYRIHTGVSFVWGKVWPGRDPDHSPWSSAEVTNEQELYSSPTWCLHGSSSTALLESRFKTRTNCNLKLCVTNWQKLLVGRSVKVTLFKFDSILYAYFGHLKTCYAHKSLLCNFPWSCN
jgi:hypothetical protein